MRKGRRKYNEGSRNDGNAEGETKSRGRGGTTTQGRGG